MARGFIFKARALHFCSKLSIEQLTQLIVVAREEISHKQYKITKSVEKQKRKEVKEFKKHG